MSRSTTAVVLSALVLPGAGHLYLKQAVRGMVLIAVSLVCLGFIVSQAMRQASAILVQLESEGSVLDSGQLAELVSQSASHAGSGTATAATLVLVACWLFGIVDAYRQGQREVRKSAQAR